MQTSGGDVVRPTDGANAAVDFAFGSDSTRDRGRDQVIFALPLFYRNFLVLNNKFSLLKRDLKTYFVQ